MSQHVADVNLVSIIMHRRDQSNFVASDIEDSEFPYLISMRKCFPQLREICEAAFPHDRVPMSETVRLTSRSEFICVRFPKRVLFCGGVRLKFERHRW